MLFLMVFYINTKQISFWGFQWETFERFFQGGDFGRKYELSLVFWPLRIV